MANCAADQGGYWPMHDRLFLGLGEQAWGQGGQADFTTFLGYAAELELDAAAIQQCVVENTYAQQIEADFREATRQGVRSTPSFVVNGKLLVGAQPFQVWQQVLDQLLAEEK